MITLARAARDPRLLGATITWRERQLEILEQLGLDTTRVMIVSAGRQGGKTSIGVAAGLHNATLCPHLDAVMRPGQIRYVLLVSPREDQAREMIQVAASMVDASPALRARATIRADRIDFELASGARTALRALPANPRSIRGMTASMCIGDEFAWFNADGAAFVSDQGIIEAIEGSMSIFDAVGLSKMALLSTPHGEQGAFYELFLRARDGELPGGVAVHAPAWELNPALDNEEWKESKRRLLGVDGFEQEHGARFIAGGGAFFDLRGVEFADGPVAPAAATCWVAGLDPAFAADRFAVALVGQSTEEPGMLVTGVLDAISPGERLRSLEARRGREDATLARVWALLEPYVEHGLRIVTDQHQADAVVSYFGRRGVAVDVTNWTAPLQTAAFTSTRARLIDGSLRLWRHPLLLEELRRVRAKDTESIVLPRFGGGHCDIASALSLAVYELRWVSDAPQHEAVAGRSAWAAHVLAGIDVGVPLLTGDLRTMPM